MIFITYLIIAKLKGKLDKILSSVQSLSNQQNSLNLLNKFKFSAKGTFFCIEEQKNCIENFS